MHIPKPLLAALLAAVGALAYGIDLTPACPECPVCEAGDVEVEAPADAPPQPEAPPAP